MMQSSANEALKANNVDLGSRIGRICSLIGSNSFSTACRAALRRLNPHKAPSLVFYRFAVYHLPKTWEARKADWMTLTAGIATMSPSIHRPGQGLGQVLGLTGYSEARLERLLSAEGDTRRILFLRAVRFLAAKSAPFDWKDGALFLLLRDREKQERLHARIAQDYYRYLQMD